MDNTNKKNNENKRPVIAIGVNTYCEAAKLSTRQSLCHESLKALKAKYNDKLILVNIQFKDETHEYDFFDTTVSLDRSSVDVVTSSSKKLPLSLDVFNALSNLNCFYFVYLNDDIIVKSRLIETVLENSTYDSFVASRMDVEPLNNLKEKPTYVNYNTHGFDLFVIKSKWWTANKQYFPNFILGRYYWDVYYYSLCNTFGRSKTLNALPPCILHQVHESVSSPGDLEQAYNGLQANNIFLQAWFSNVQYNLRPRAEYMNIKNCIPNSNEESGTDRFYKEFYEKNISNIR